MRTDRKGEEHPHGSAYDSLCIEFHLASAHLQCLCRGHRTGQNLGKPVIGQILWIFWDGGRPNFPCKNVLKKNEAPQAPVRVIRDGLVAVFIFFVSKELWESLALERGELSGTQVLVLIGLSVGNTLATVVMWILQNCIKEFADKIELTSRWPTPLAVMRKPISSNTTRSGYNAT